MNSAYLWSRAALVTNKKENISRYKTTNLLKSWFLILVSMTGQKKDKSEFVTKFVGVTVTIILI